MNIAVLGANGFIGSRAVEMLHLGELAEVRPVVRSIASLARLSRFDVDSRVADARDQHALEHAFAGCDVVVHAIAGDRRTILETLEPAYRAAEAAGVRRLVYLSTAAVHGQAPPPGTDETSPLNDRQPIPYNNAKVLAERRLLQLREQGSVELVMLRPGIVFGPRSFWITSFAAALLAGTAYLVNDGRGICNSVYVDNLIHAALLATRAPAADRQAFLIGDTEQVTWADFYQPVAEALGFDMRDVARLAYMEPVPRGTDRVRAMLKTRPAQTLLSPLPARLRHVLGTGVFRLLASPAPPKSPWTLPDDSPNAGRQPVATLEMALLHQCQYKLPYTKAATVLGYAPAISFPDACRRSIAWLAFAGYPVIDHYNAQDR